MVLVAVPLRHYRGLHVICVLRASAGTAPFQKCFKFARFAKFAKFAAKLLPFEFLQNISTQILIAGEFFEVFVYVGGADFE